jgi:hypothetical protein
LSCEACLCDDVKGKRARAEHELRYGDDLVTRLCDAHLRALQAAVRQEDC